MFVDRPLIKQQLVAIPTVNISAGTFPFPPQNNLRDVYVWGLSVYFQELLPLTPEGDPVYKLSDVNQMYINMQDYFGFEFINYMPLAEFANIGAGAAFLNTLPPVLTGQQINWDKGFITCPDPTILSAKKSIVMNIWYSLSLELEIEQRKFNFNNKG